MDAWYFFIFLRRLQLTGETLPHEINIAPAKADINVMVFPYRESLNFSYAQGGGKWFASPGWVEIERKKGFADCISGVCPCVETLTRPGYLSVCGNNRLKSDGMA